MRISHFVDPSVVYRLRNNGSEGKIEWPNVLVTADAKSYCKESPETALSVFSNRSGKVKIKVNNRDLQIYEETVMLVNPYEKMEYEIQSEAVVSVHNVHFNYTFYKQAVAGLVTSDDQLLDDPEAEPDRPFFTSQLYHKDSEVKKMLHSYCEDDIDNYFFKMLQLLLTRDRKARLSNKRIASTKAPTRNELMRRMVHAKDIIFSAYDQTDLDLDRLSREVAMSRFHFLRVFKQVFGITPYQMLKIVRMERTRYLLEHTDLSVTEIALQVGMQEPTALYPLVKKYLSSTPSGYRKNSNFK